MTRSAVVTRLLLTAILAGLPSIPAFAFNDPGGFRGIPWGTTLDQFKAKLEIGSCMDTRDGPGIGDYGCRGMLTIGPVRVEAWYKFRTGQFVQVLLSFAASDFSTMQRIFIARYGPPTSRIGPLFSWTGHKTTVHLIDSGGQENSMGILTSSGELGEPRKNTEEEMLRGADDL